MEITFEVQAPTAAINRLAGTVDPAVAAGLQRVAGHVQSLAIRKVAAIRRRRVPTRREAALYNQRKRGATKKRQIRAGSDPAWRPTGALLRAVEAEPQLEGPDAIRLTADVPYAETRHEIGVSWIPKNPALGIVRRDPFFSDALAIAAPQIEPLFADGFGSVWGK